MRLGTFLDMLERETGLRTKEIEILTGYPPAPVRVPHDPDSLLSCLAISNGDTLLIRRQENASAAAPEPSAVTSNMAASSIAPQGTQVQDIPITAPQPAGFKHLSFGLCLHRSLPGNTEALMECLMLPSHIIRGADG